MFGRDGAGKSFCGVTTRSLARLHMEDNMVAVVGTALGTGTILAGIIYMGDFVLPAVAGVHVVPDSTKTEASPDADFPPLPARTPVKDYLPSPGGVRALAAAIAYAADIASSAQKFYLGSSVVDPTAGNSRRIGATYAADFAFAANRTVFREGTMGTCDRRHPSRQ